MVEDGRIKASPDSDTGYAYFGEGYDRWEAIGNDMIVFHDGDRTFTEYFKRGTSIMLEDNTFPAPEGKTFGWWSGGSTGNSFRYHD